MLIKLKQNIKKVSLVFGLVIFVSICAFVFYPINLLSQTSGQANEFFYGRFLYTPTTTPDVPDLNNVSAKSYLVTKSDGTIVLSKNTEEAFPIASITKLMTGTMAIEKLRMKRIGTITSKDRLAFGDSGGFKVGDRISVENLLYPLLMSSSNDAAETLSNSMGIKNSRKVFILEMNRKAKDIGMTKTFFDDPSGLSLNNSSTVKDLDILLRYVNKKHPAMISITSIDQYQFRKYDWFNTSSLTNISGYMSGKTGFTTPARQTAVGTFLTKVSSNAIEPYNYMLLYSENRNADIELLRRYIEYTVR